MFVFQPILSQRLGYLSTGLIRYAILSVLLFAFSSIFAQPTRLHLDFRNPGDVFSTSDRAESCAQWIRADSSSDESRIFLVSSTEDPCKASWELTIPLSTDDKVTILEFSHQYVFPEGSGGRVEISYDSGINWTNLADDRYGEPLTRFYSAESVLPDGNPAFIGASNQSRLSRYQWVWQGKQPELLRLRFVWDKQLKSDTSPVWVFSEVWIFGVSY